MNADFQRKIKIFFLITDSHFGGAETLLYQSVLALDKKRYEPLVCSLKPEGDMLRRLQSQGINTLSLNFNLKRQWWRLGHVFAALRRHVRNFRPDILHASLFQADIMGTLAAVAEGVPVRIATVHMVLRSKRYAVSLEAWFRRWITHYVAVSNEIRKQYIRRGVPENKISVIYNVVDAQEVMQRAADQSAPITRLSGDTPWICSIGRLDPQKDYPNLLQALQRLKEQGASLKAIIIGEGPARRHLESLRAGWGLADMVHFAGFHSNPMPLLNQCRAMVLSSEEEGLPFAILEAMALGKPVVSTAVGAVPEAVEDGKTGFLVKPKQPEQLAQAILKIIQDPGLAERMGKEAQSRIKERFCIEQAVTQMDALYTRLLKESNGWIPLPTP